MKQKIIKSGVALSLVVMGVVSASNASAGQGGRPGPGPTGLPGPTGGELCSNTEGAPISVHDYKGHLDRRETEEGRANACSASESAMSWECLRQANEYIENQIAAARLWCSGQKLVVECNGERKEYPYIFSLVCPGAVLDIETSCTDVRPGNPGYIAHADATCTAVPAVSSCRPPEVKVECDAPKPKPTSVVGDGILD